MNSSIDDDLRVTEHAAQWLGTLLDGNEKRAAFFAWLAESPRHVEEFLCVLTCAQELIELTPERRERIEQLSAELGSGDARQPFNVVPLSARALRSYEAPSGTDVPAGPGSRDALNDTRRPRTWTRRMLALAASVVVAVTASWWVFGPGSWTTYSTQVGERRDITLADGSSLHLNTDTKIAVRLTAEARTVRLIHGEALFSVAHDALRPFRVRAAETVIQAIGTQFDVYRKQTSTRVAVIEGLVQISAAADPIPRFPSLSSGHPHGASGTPTGSVESPEVRTASQQVSHLLGAGQEAEVSAQGTLSRQEKADTAKDVSWRQGRLVFEDDTLGEIANEFNRYNVVVKIRVIGAAANNEHFSGTFDADAPEAIMQALAEDPTLEVKREGDEILIQGRNAAQEPATPMDRNDTR